jgi:hypothetical protein
MIGYAAVAGDCGAASALNTGKQIFVFLSTPWIPVVTGGNSGNFFYVMRRKIMMPRAGKNQALVPVIRLEIKIQVCLTGEVCKRIDGSPANQRPELLFVVSLSQVFCFVQRVHFVFGDKVDGRERNILPLACIEQITFRRAVNAALVEGELISRKLGCSNEPGIRHTTR